MPLVKARDTGYGMKRMMEPSFARPITQSMAPAIMVQTMRPLPPYAARML